MADFLMVTGRPKVSQKNAEAFAHLWQAVHKHPATFYVLGGLFDPGDCPDKEAAARYMKALPGRKVLVLHEALAAPYEADLNWFDVVYTQDLNVWGKRIGLSASAMGVQGMFNVHCDPEPPDTEFLISAAWDRLTADHGQGIRNLYELSILADHLGTGFLEG